MTSRTTLFAILLCLACLSVQGGWRQEQGREPLLVLADDGKPTGPKIQFEELVADLGVIDAGKEPERLHTFRFVNEGGAPLVIHDVETSCGCTTASYTKKPVKPGKKGEVKVKFSAVNQQKGIFHRVVTVYSNDRQKYTRLHVKGEIVHAE